MNSLTPLSLPRFHVNALAQTQKEKKVMVGDAPPDKPFEAELGGANESTEQDAEASADAIDATLPPLQPEIDTGAILQSLESQVNELQRAALVRVTELARAFIEAAFPRLAENFLAEEVVRELEATAPPEIEKLVLKVPTQFGASFQSAIQASPRLNEISEVQMLDAATEIQIDADWQTGGLQFDMQRFIESSLARMSGPESV